MTKKIITPVLILTFILSAINFNVAYAAPQFDVPEEDAVFKCYDDINYPGDCSSGTDEMTPYTSSGTSGPPDWNYFTDSKVEAVAVLCEPYPDCLEGMKIFFRVAVGISWQTDVLPFSSVALTVEVHGANFVDTQSSQVSCGSGMSGSCSIEFSGVLDVNEYGRAGWGYDIESISELDTTGGGHYWYEAVRTYEVYYSLLPFSDCEDERMTPSTDTYELDPELELPLGPLGSPVDNQIYSTVPGEVYQLEIAGGPWNDGAEDRTDVAISWDGETWTPLIEIPVLCKSQNETDGQITIYYIEALSSTFYIRVNDEPGEFTGNFNNPDPMTYAIGISFGVVPTACDSQYTYDTMDDLVNFFSVDGNDSNGVRADDPMVPLVVGEWYIVSWNYGGWQDNGGADRIDLEYATTFMGAWSDLSASSTDMVWCVTPDGYDVLFQASSTTLYVRANDTDLNFGNNSGTAYYDLYHVTFVRTPETCETQYDVGEKIESKIVDGDKSGGEVFAYMSVRPDNSEWGNVEHGGWYVLDTTGGPWWEMGGTNYQYNMEVKVDDGAWEPLATWSYPVCNFKIDSHGHRRIIFQMPNTGVAEWYLRVADEDGIFWGNSGSMGWDLYGATRMVVDPDEGGQCDYTYDVGDIIDYGTIDAKSENGMTIDNLVSGETYVIRILGDPPGSYPFWKDSILSGDNRYDAEIKQNTSWYDAGSLPSKLCSSTSGNNTDVYFTAQQNYTYAVRVNTQDSNFANNVGSLTFAVYGAAAGQTVFNTCFDGWSLQELDPFQWIDVRDEQGEFLLSDNARYVEFTALVPGNSYAVEVPVTGSGPWGSMDAPNTARWDAAISNDNGTTWEELSMDSTLIDCASRTLVGNIIKAKFTALNGQVWKIRVNDTANNFTDNSGNLAFKFYVLCQGMACTGSLPNDSTTNGIPAINIQGGGNVCSMAVLRPGSLSFAELFDVGNYIASWLQYFNLSVLRYMAWCPTHTRTFLDFLNSFKNREPLATIYEWDATLEDIQREINSYDWDNGGQDTSLWDVDSPDEAKDMITEKVFGGGNESAWNGGGISFGQGTSLPDSYYSCGSAMTAAVPASLRSGICFVSAYFIETSASFWIQIMIDISALFMLLGTLKDAIQETVYIMTGVRPWQGSNRQNWVTIEREMRNDSGGGSSVENDISNQLGGRWERNSDGSYSRRR